MLREIDYGGGSGMMSYTQFVASGERGASKILTNPKSWVDTLMTEGVRERKQDLTVPVPGWLYTQLAVRLWGGHPPSLSLSCVICELKGLD